LELYLGIRRIAEVILALLLLFALSPIAVIVALAIKSDGGPALFRQHRLGKDSRKFEILKFRTMIVDADKYLDENNMPTRSRITRVGRILRATSLDEIPQLINIIKGDMGIVGPRPILPRMLPYMTEEERRRFLVRPGITGLAQVSGRNTISWSKRFQLDVEYIEKLSIWLDVKICFQTVGRVVSSSDIVQDRNSVAVDDVTTRQVSE
jgi:sugar transferase EpsL